MRPRRTAFELLDSVRAQSSPFGQGILCEPKRETMPPQEPTESVGRLARLDFLSGHLHALSLCRSQASPD